MAPEIININKQPFTFQIFLVYQNNANDMYHYFYYQYLLLLYCDSFNLEAFSEIFILNGDIYLSLFIVFFFNESLPIHIYSRLINLIHIEGKYYKGFSSWFSTILLGMLSHYFRKYFLYSNKFFHVKEIKGERNKGNRIYIQIVQTVVSKWKGRIDEVLQDKIEK